MCTNCYYYFGFMFIFILVQCVYCNLGNVASSPESWKVLLEK